MKENIQIRWSDIDANNHLRHSAYYDFGAMCRINQMNHNGLSIDYLKSKNIGPIILREEAIFRREIKMENLVFIDLKLIAANRDFSRWYIRHELTFEDGKIAATINIDGAWLDLERRKFAIPDEDIKKTFNSFEKSNDFKWIEN